MTMYGSELLGWWNTAFMDMKHDGSFRRLCQTAARVHGKTLCKTIIISFNNF